MKKLYLLFLVVFMAIQFSALAERINRPDLKLPGLIITEVRPDGESTTYVELTNVGDSAINLSSAYGYFVLNSFFYNSRINSASDSLISIRNTANTNGKVYLKGILQPGESFVVATVWDANDARGSGIPYHNTAIARIGNQFVHKLETANTLGWINKPEWQCFGKDSVSATPRSEQQKLYGMSSAAYLLKWVFKKDSVNLDSTFIDNFNFFFDPTNNPSGMKGNAIFSIAGVDDAMTTGVMVRKSVVKKGNLDWNQSRGIDATTSEWLVVPKNSSQQDAFATVGVHGNYNLDYTVKDPSTIIINETAKIISVPWEMVRGDSLSHYFKLGKGMAWSYGLNDVFEDSASYIARNGDMFYFYATGNELKKAYYTLKVRNPEPDVAMVFPKRRLILGEEFVMNEAGQVVDTIATRSWSNGFVYGVVKGSEIDSIINVPFATRTDSLLKYLEKPAKAKLEFVFVDGKARVDLKFGDKLRVTSENGATVKDYFVVVSDYIPSENALLSTVTWPDIDKTLYPRWTVGDTLPEFTPLKTEYVVELRYDARRFPSFQYKTQDLKSRIEVKNAVDIDGTDAQRTTSVTVYAESDTTFLTYNFHFIKQGVPVQPNVAEPFFSEWIRGVTTQGYAIEIYNPGTEDLDLSRYCIVRGTASQTWQEAAQTLITGNTSGSFATSDGSIKIYQTHYFPSKRWTADGSMAEWNAVPDAEHPYVGRGFLKDDNQTDPWVKGQDVWVCGIGMKTPGTVPVQDKIIAESDFIFRGRTEDNTANAWPGIMIYQQANPAWTRNYLYLLKVLNDSILNGTKDVRDASAYELIDRFDAKGDSLAGVKINSGSQTLVRKPSVSKGTLDRIGGGKETAESSQWIVRTSNYTDNLGIHVMDPLTNFKSTVTSVKLVVTPGYKGNSLSITGNIADYTPKTISLVLDKADTSQVFVFKRGATVLTADLSLADADVLEVTSGDGRATTIYKLINSPLDNNTSLTAKAGSDLTVSGNKVSGVTVGMTLKEAIANLVVSNKSVLNVLDSKTGAFQPVVIHNLDSLVNDVLVSDKLFLQVVAESSDNAVYSFDFGFASNKAVLMSNILKIDQENKRIMELPINSTPMSMLSMLFANEGATLKILDKAGFERTIGFLSIDDVVEVTAADGVTKVIYGFDAGMFPVSVDRSVESSVNVVIFPNPVTYILNIKGLELASVQVFSLSGTMVISQSSVSNRIDVSDLPFGIYIIKMTDVTGKVAVDKFLKK